MSEIEAIYTRRTVRDYKSQKIEKNMIQTLLDAAVQAPTAMHEEPWSFVVIQDQTLLNQLSESAKAVLYNEARSYPKQMKGLIELVENPEFHLFYNANTLIVIYSKFPGPYVEADCWLAAENLMLTACAQGLGTCVVALAITALNSPEWKSKLHVSTDMTAVAPIILGVPASETPTVPRKEPEIISWH